MTLSVPFHGHHARARAEPAACHTPGHYTPQQRAPCHPTLRAEGIRQRPPRDETPLEHPLALHVEPDERLELLPVVEGRTGEICAGYGGSCDGTGIAEGVLRFFAAQ